jgi:hypothetical protein
VPLRLVLWLVVPCLAGGALGVSFAGRPVHAPAPVAAAPQMKTIQRTGVAPRRVYRNANARPGLVALDRSSLASSPLLGATTASVTSRAARRGDVVAFTPGDRAFAEASAPAPAPAPAPGPIETTPFTTTDGGTAAATPTPTTATVSSTPITISDVHTVSLTPFSATIGWRTSEPVESRIAYGPVTPTLWTADGPADVDHVAEVSGVPASSSWNLWVTAKATDGRTATAPYMLTTPPLTGNATASTQGGAFRIDGQPYFPTIVWNACPFALPKLMSLGIDLFMANACGNATDQLPVLGGRGFAVSNAREAPEPGAVGTYLPDEWDTFLPGNLTADAAHTLVPSRGAPGPRFLTLTNHFYSKAAPLPQGRGMYPALVGIADVIGFDLYPLQNWCRYDSFGDVFESQRELVTLAQGKPTFQWIEARRMDCHDPTLDPSADTVRAETWLAIAGGAHAIAYFPNDWSAAVDGEIARSKGEIQSLVPALLEPALPASANNSQVKVSARVHNGALYVIAVNASRSAQAATFSVPLLGDRGLVSLTGDRATVAAGGAFSDTFTPLEVRVYVSPPTTG